MYKVIVKFADAQDFHNIYEVDDVYPREGYTPSPERIEELMSNKNRLRTPLIVEVKESVKKTEPVEEAKAEDKDEVVVKKRKKKAEE